MKEKSFERKQELIKAALDEFITRSYDEASLNNIVKRARISKGTFYYHFQDKQTLYLYLLEYAVELKWDFIKEKMKDLSEGFPNQDLFEQFKLQARMGVEFAEAYPEYYQLGRMFSKEKGNTIYNVALEMLGKGSENLLEGRIAEAIEKGHFRSDLPHDFIVKIINFMFVHFDEIFQAEEGWDLPKTLGYLDLYVDFIKKGLGK